MASELNELPEEYKSESQRRCNMDMDEDQGPRGATIIKEKEAPGITHGQSLPEPNVKIRLTKCGLTFSGPTAFPSNMNRADFVFDGQP